MSISLMTFVWENSPAKGNELLLHLALADSANDSTGECWPSVTTLAKKTRQSERSVQRMLQSLESRGLIRIKPRVNRSSLYSVFRAVEKPVETLQKTCDEGCQIVTPGVTVSTSQGCQIEQKGVSDCHPNLKITVSEPEIEPSAEAAAAGGSPTSKPKPENPNRDEKSRRAALSEARTRGLRDFVRYPLEAWEEPIQPWELEKRNKILRRSSNRDLHRVSSSELKASLRASGSAS